MKSATFRLSVAFAASVPVLAIFSAYTIAPGDNIHERMTMASRRCVDAAFASNQKPAQCDLNISKDLPKPDMTWIADAGSKVPDLEAAVRWPDDPTHQIKLTTAIKALAATSKCKKKAEKEGREAAESFQGLLCSSNFGTLQFFHAQATSRGETAAETHYKIMHWAEFLYDVATTYTDAQLDQRYCEVFGAGNDAFDKAMVPEANSKRCGDGKHPGWAVRTLFTTKCNNILWSKVCREDKSADRYSIARMYAMGSLLHLIQDSYSQSHCVRSDCQVDSTKKVVAKVECTPIRMYTTYVGQENHGDADREPNFAASCTTTRPQTDDPVTSGAKILWDIRNRVAVDLFKQDLERVFGTTQQAAALPAADLGECFTANL